MSNKPAFKPMFFWWAHKMLWGLLSNYPDMRKMDAVARIAKKYPAMARRLPISDCFACQCVAAYLHENNIRNKSKSCDYCPLNWGSTRTCYPNDGLFTMWDMAVTPEDKRFFAAQIRDLPLKENARKIYDVKERPDD